VLQAVRHRRLGVGHPIRAVHGLQHEMAEREPREPLGRRIWLR